MANGSHRAGRLQLVEDDDRDRVPQWFDAELDRVISDFDRAHTFVTSGMVELPFGRERRWAATGRRSTNTLLGGWQVALHLKAQSGAPLGFGNFLFADGMGVGDIMADKPTGHQRWFNVNAFNRVTGAAARVERAHATEPIPGGARARICRARSRHPEERRHGGARQVQFRLEAYNTLNRANLNNRTRR